MHNERPRYQRYCFKLSSSIQRPLSWTFKIRPFDTLDFNTLALTDYLSLPESPWEIIGYCSSLSRYVQYDDLQQFNQPKGYSSPRLNVVGPALESKSYGSFNLNGSIR